MKAIDKSGKVIPVLLPTVFLENEEDAFVTIAATGWILCPDCRKKMEPIMRTTSGVNIPAYCRKCKKRYWVTIR